MPIAIPPSPFGYAASCFALLLLMLAPQASGQGLHKCRQPDGGVSYQDQRCAPGSELKPPVIAPPPAWQPPPAVTAPTAAKSNPPNQPVPPSPPAPPLPSLYRCTREEGGSYVGNDPHPPGRYVPLWTLDRLAPTFSNTGTSLGGTGAGYTYVEDHCYAMSRGEICAHLRERYDKAYGERQRAFNDTRPALEGEVASLREQLSAHCGR